MFFFFFFNSYFVQLFIFFNYCLFNSIFHPLQYIYIFLIFIWFSLDFKIFFHYIFLNSIVSLHSTFHLLPPFLFHLNFHINFFLITSFTPLFPIFSKLSMTKRSMLSLFLQFCFSFGWFFFFLIVSTTFFFLLMVLFVIAVLFLGFIYFHLITRKKKCNSILGFHDEWVWVFMVSKLFKYVFSFSKLIWIEHLIVFVINCFMISLL